MLPRYPSIPAAALAAVKDGFVFSTAAAQGMVEVTEVRDFAGKDIEVKKLVDANSEAAEKVKGAAGLSSVVDTLLQQIKKKWKLSVLDNTKDWGEYKDDNKGVGEELDACKKSSERYLGRVFFFERADYRMQGCHHSLRGGLIYVRIEDPWSLVNDVVNL